MPELDICRVWEDVPDSNTNVDSFAHMILRRLFSDLAEHPMDPYIETYVQAQKHGVLTDESVVLDVGGSSGEFALNALRKLHVRPELYVVDPNYKPYADTLEEYLKVKKLDPSRLHFIRGKGENIEMPPNSAQVATAINAAFRADDLMMMVKSMQDVTVPGGYIGISSNYLDHGFIRHNCESRLSGIVGQSLGRQLPSVRPPAYKAAFDYLPSMLEKIDGFEIIHTKEQVSRVTITEDGLFEDLMSVLKMSGHQAQLNMEKEYPLWTEVVDTAIRPLLLAIMEESPNGGSRYFYDIVHRGVVVGVNHK